MISSKFLTTLITVVGKEPALKWLKSQGFKSFEEYDTICCWDEPSALDVAIHEIWVA